jgi:hypothetical protein
MTSESVLNDAHVYLENVFDKDDMDFDELILNHDWVDEFPSLQDLPGIYSPLALLNNRGGS